MFPRFTFCYMDTTVFQAHSNLLKASMSSLSTICNLGAKNIGHVQFPVPHSNTTGPAIAKHRRILEDHFMAARLDTSHQVALYVTRPADAPASDRRQGIHPAMSVTVDARSSPWTCPDMIGPVALVRVSDMIGYDPDSRPGATARVEQSFSSEFDIFLFGPYCTIN